MVDNADLEFYVPFNIILVTSRWWEGDNEGLHAIKLHTVMSWIPPPAESEPGTPW